MEGEQALCEGQSSGSLRTGSVLQTLNKLVLEGVGLQAQVLQLKEDLPPSFQLDAKPSLAPVLFDFKYLHHPSYQEDKVASNKQLVALDAECKQNFSSLVEAGYSLFECTVQFHSEVAGFLSDVEAGRYVQTSLEAIMQDHERQQLLLEVLYALASLLLLIDRSIPGALRERIAVAHCRYKWGFENRPPTAETVFQLCRRTGYVPNRHPPPGYPEEYLTRFPLPEQAIRFAIGCLLSADVYSAIPHYPNPSHRTTALSTQASYAFVLLFYVPQILHRDAGIMQKVVERFFSDRWVLSWAPGEVVDLGHEWTNFSRARAALSRAIPPARARKLRQQQLERVGGLVGELNRYLRAGGLQEDVLLQQNSDIFSLIREGNVTARWILLHGFSTSRRQQSNCNDVAQLILNLAAFEYEVGKRYKQLLDTSQARRAKSCQIVKENLRNLAELCRTPPKGSSHQRESHLGFWLQRCEWELDTLGQDSPRKTAEKLRSLRRAVEDMGHFGRLENLAPRSPRLVQEILSNLKLMIQFANVSQGLLETLRVVREFSYALKLMLDDEAIRQLRTLTSRDPKMLWKLGCLVLKMKSITDVPVICGKSGDREPHPAMLQFLDSKVVSFAEAVVDHVPICVCEALDRIAYIHARVINKKPDVKQQSVVRRRLMEDKSKDNDAEDEEGNGDAYGSLVKLIARIAKFSKGVTAIEQCLEGAVSLRLRHEFEEHLRRHVAKRLAVLCHQGMYFSNTAPPFTFASVSLHGAAFTSGKTFSGKISGCQEFEEKLTELRDSLGAYCKALLCVQDYLRISGLSLWNDELALVIAVKLQEECLSMEQGLPCEAGASSKRVVKGDSDSAVTFLGRLSREVIRLTSPATTHFSKGGNCWLDAEGNTVFGMESVSTIRACIGSRGLAALDALLSARLSSLFDRLHRYCKEVVSQSADSTDRWAHQLADCDGLEFPQGGAAWYVNTVNSVGKRFWAPLLDIMAAIGQSQLLRRLLALELQNGCMLDAPASLSRSLAGLQEHIQMRMLAEDDRDLSEDGPILGSEDTNVESDDPICSGQETGNAATSGAASDTGGGRSMGCASEHGEVPVTTADHPISVNPVRVDVIDVALRTEGGERLDDGLLANGALQHAEDAHAGSESAAAGIQDEQVCVGMEGNGAASGEAACTGQAADDEPRPPCAPSMQTNFNTIPTATTESSTQDCGGPSPFTQGPPKGAASMDDDSAAGPIWRPPDDVEGGNAPAMCEAPWPIADSGRESRSIRVRRNSDSPFMGRWRSERSMASLVRTPTSNSSVSAVLDPSLNRANWGNVRQSWKHVNSEGSTAGSWLSSRLLSQGSITSWARSWISFIDSSFFTTPASACDLNEYPMPLDLSTPLAPEFLSPVVYSLLQSTGFVDPMAIRYTSKSRPPSPEIPAVLFLAILSVINRYELRSYRLMRPLCSPVPDAGSFITGLVTILSQYMQLVTDQFLQYIGQYLRAYLKTATSSRAQGIEAVGVEITLPQEVRRMVVFVDEVCRTAGWPRSRAQKFIPPLLMQAWMMAEPGSGQCERQCDG
eukprot:evm.model.scf_385.1 EVM.evm.TU.scf_385.1   scf_385:2889-12069(-)